MKANTDDLAVIQAVYEDDAVESVGKELKKRLPHRSVNGMQVTACLKGWAEERKERRKAKGLTKQPKPARKSGGGIAKQFPAAQPKRPRPGPCDRGERETIRKRLLSLIPMLAGELDRAPTQIANAVREVVASNYRSENPLGRGYNLGDLAEVVSRRDAYEAGQPARSA